MLQQVLRAARLDRNLYSELIFDSYATGNAVLVVVGIYGAVFAARVIEGARFSIPLALNVVLSGIVQWLIAALALWLAGTKLYPGDARVPTIVRLTGFAHVALIPLVIEPFVSSPLSQLVFLAAIFWFGVSLVLIAEVSMSLERRQSSVSALIAVAVWWVFQGIFGAAGF